MRIVFISLILLLLNLTTVTAQDPVFSLYFNNLVALNPALAGVNGTYNVSSQFRQQWAPIVNNNFSTATANFDLSICSKNVDRYGLGVNLYSNKGGDGFLFNNFVGIDYSFMAINSCKKKKAHLLSFGLEGGWGITYIDWSKLVFSNQLDPRDGIITGSTNHFVSQNYGQRNYFDAAAGIFYRYKNENKFKNRFSGGNIGLSVHHLPRPNNGLAYNDNYQYPMKLTFHSGLEFPFYYRNRTKEMLRLQVRVRVISQFFKSTNFTFVDIGNTFVFPENRFYSGFLLRFVPKSPALKNTYGTSFFIGYVLKEKNPQINIAYAFENSIKGVSKDIVAGSTTSHEFSLNFIILNKKSCPSCGKKGQLDCFDF